MRDLDQRKVSVESSFKLDLPPHLIIPSAAIKLNETIGQGNSVLVSLSPAFQLKLNLLISVYDTVTNSWEDQDLVL